MFLREYQPSDAEILAAIYRDAVLEIGSSAYDTKQVKVWSSFSADLVQFNNALSQGLTIVALHNGQLVAFGQLNPPDHIALLYTASSFARMGYATKIYQRLETQAIVQKVERLYTEASRISKHFLLKMGFHLIETEIVERQGVEFERFKMEKIILKVNII